MTVIRVPVDVIMERVPVASRWVSDKWQPAAVVATGTPVTDVDWVPGPPQRLTQTPDGTQWCFPACAVELHRSEAEGYYLNLSAPQPSVFVMWRFVDDDAEPRARPVVVTLSYNEAARMMDGGEQVDAVPMPPALHAWLAPFVAEHYKPEPKKKARRNDPFAEDNGRNPMLDEGKLRRR